MTASTCLPLGVKHGDSVQRCPYFQTQPLLALSMLAFRLLIGLAFFYHGQGKMLHADSWMGPGVPSWMQAMAAFAEYGGGIAIALGFLTPIACLGIIATMIGAMTMVHIPVAHPFVSATGGHSSELAMVYLMSSFLILVHGPGALSIDYLILKFIYKPKADGTIS
jgi:putative oxidoreductase